MEIKWQFIYEIIVFKKSNKHFNKWYVNDLHNI